MKTQTCCISGDCACCSGLCLSEINMRKVDGWQTLTTISIRIDRA